METQHQMTGTAGSSIAGKCLIASPHLADGNFYRSVIYILQHDPSEAFGLIINRPSSHSVRQAVQSVCDVDFSFDDSLYSGGPVEGPLFALHDQTDVETYLETGLANCSTQHDALLALFDRKCRLRVFDGYAGWGAGQLDEELAAGGWLVASLTANELFGESDHLWELLVNRVGSQILGDSLAVSKMPSDPSMN
jgi:putative transcriptional regulator